MKGLWGFIAIGFGGTAVSCAESESEVRRDGIEDAGGSGGAGSGGADGSGGREVVPDFNAQTSPECFAEAAELAQSLDDLRVCTATADCESVYLWTLACLVPESAAEAGYCFDFSLSASADAATLFAADNALATCLGSAFFANPHGVTVEGRHCRPPCGLEAERACVAGRCVVVPW
jgi:hypothetical protein